MTTPFVEELALFTKNNEAISEIVYINVEHPDGTVGPMDLTGREFFAQARRAKSKDADLICDISVSIYGDPKDGALEFFVSDTVMKTVAPGKGFYDLLMRTGPTAPIDNLYQAPFIVEGGVTQWTP